MDRTRLHFLNRIATYRRSLMRFLWFMSLVVFGANQLSAQCTLACNDELQINLNQDGNFLVTPSLLHTGSITNCPNLGVELYDSNNIFIGNVITCAQAGTTVTGRLINHDNNVFCDTDLLVFDNIQPVFTCTDTFVMCNAATTPADIGFPVITDNCTVFQDADLNFSDVLFNLPCFETVNSTSVSARIERTWWAIDENGNQGSCVQIIYLTKPSLSDVVFPPHYSGMNALSCSLADANDFLITGVPTIGGASIDPNGFCDISILHDDQVFNTCGGGTTTIRKWLALDVCNNTVVNFDQIIEIKDNIAPVLTCPADLTISANSFSCDGTLTIPSINVTDECSDFTLIPSWEFGQGFGPFTNVPQGQHELTYVATDACGNSSSCSINVNIIDDTPPTPVCEDGISVSLLPAGLARVFASTFDEGSFDNCGVDRFEVSRDGVNFGNFVEFNCADIVGAPVLVTFRAYDQNGLFNQCNVGVTVRDNFSPSISCPSNIILDCDTDIMDLNITGQPNASDACGIDAVTFEDTNNFDCGTGTILREWTVVDIYGNSSSCIQTIQLEDNSVLSIGFPDDIIVDFSTGGTGTSQTGEPVLSGQGCKNILVNFEDQNFSSNSFCYSILRTWTVINWCEFDPNSGSNTGQYVHTQKIDVFDNGIPILTCPSDTLIHSLSSDCSSSFINISLPVATDISGATFIVNNSPFALASNEDASGFYPNGIHEIEYTAFDNCGNSTSCIQVVEIVDGLGPNLICNSNISIEMTAGGQVTLNPALFVASVSDNCTPTNQLNFDLFPSIFDCDDIGLQVVQLTVTDADGNQTFCNALVEVQDNMFSCSNAEIDISGVILNPQGRPLDGVEVSANGVYFADTDASGNYTFNNLPAGQDYLITAVDDPLEQNGISTFDLVLLSAHILQTRRINNPYVLIAGDVDNDNSISVFDLLNIRQLILEKISSYSSDIAWKCIDANFAFTDSNNPFLDDYPLTLSYPQLNTDVQNANFIAVKLGDVDLNAEDFGGLEIKVRSNRSTNLHIENRSFNSGTVQELEIYLEDELSLLGLQFEIDLDSEYVSFEGLLSANQMNIDGNNYVYDKHSSSLKLSWNSTIPLECIGEGRAILKLKLTIHKDCKPTDFIKFSKRSLNSELYTENYQKIDLNLKFIHPDVDSSVATFNSLGQNYPNPVVNTTSVDIVAAYATSAQLAFSTLDGKKVLLKTLYLEKGTNNIQIEKGEFNTIHPFLFYSLIIDDEIVGTKKMLFKN